MENTRVGPFKILQKLGRNRRHNVYRALQIEQQREVALKFIKLPPSVEKAKALSRIQRESKILKKLVHPHLVQVYGAGVEGEQIFFAMELIRGETLADLLTRRGKLAWDLAVDYAKQIASALEYIHNEDIIHLKLTPEKILIRDDGSIAISDLRLNRSKKRRWDAATRKALDVAAYMPPEQFTGGAGTAKSDYYALGVILFEMLTGKLPFAPDTLTQMIKVKQTQPPPAISDYNLDSPIWLDKIVAHLLHIDPARRPYSARAIVLALQEVQSIDSSGTGVAEKLTSSFNPLIAGIDKSEARKVLGHKEEKEPTTPFYQRVSVQIAGLLMTLFFIAAFLGFMLRPISDRQLYERAAVLVETDNMQDWITAKLDYLQPLVERGDDREYYAKGRELLLTIEKKRMQKRIDNRQWQRNGDSKHESAFFLALRFQEEQNYKQALGITRQLVEEIDPEGEDAYLLEMAKEKEQELIEIQSKAAIAAKQIEEAALESKTASDNHILSDEDNPPDEEQTAAETVKDPAIDSVKSKTE